MEIVFVTQLPVNLFEAHKKRSFDNIQAQKEIGGEHLQLWIAGLNSVSR